MVVQKVCWLSMRGGVVSEGSGLSVRGQGCP